jgi:hypothetical protein
MNGERKERQIGRRRRFFLGRFQLSFNFRRPRTATTWLDTVLRATSDYRLE